MPWRMDRIEKAAPTNCLSLRWTAQVEPDTSGRGDGYARISVGDPRPKSAAYSDPHSLNAGAALPVSRAVRAAAVPIGAPT